MADSSSAPRGRLSDLRDPYLPFRKAEHFVGSVLYWLPAAAYPVRSGERQWILALVKELSLALKAQQLRQENFVNYDYIYPDLHETFLAHSLRFFPIVGFLKQPSKPLFRPPAEEELKRILESGDASAVRKATKNLGYWLAKNKGVEQLQVFFGHGAMVSLWLPETEETKPPDFRIPPKVLENPAIKPLNVMSEVEFTYSLRDPFLVKSKEVFAKDLANDVQYGHLPFAAPLLNSQDILSATGETRDLWLSLFGVYMAESRDDKGILLWGRPELDPILINALATISGKGLEYPR